MLDELRKTATCWWTYSEEDYKYYTGCGEYFIDCYDFIYCPYCGNEIHNTSREED